MFGGSNTGSTSLSGNSATNNASGAGSGLFGSSKPAGTGFSFGSSNNTGSTGFGAGNANSSNSGSIFGNSNNNTNTSTSASGGIFGAKPAAPSGSFGANNNSNNTASTTSGGLFGSNNNTNTSNSSGTSGLFGAKPAAPSTGLFGNNSSTAPSSTSGGLFGSSNSGNKPSGGLFGSSNTDSKPSGGLFGGTNNNSGNLFGSTGSNSNSGTTGGLFGSGSTNSGTSGGLFGSGNTNNASGGLFGSNNNTSGGLFGSNAQQQAPNQQPSLFRNDTTNNSQPSFAWSSSQTQTGINSSANNQSSNSNNLAYSLENKPASNTYTPDIRDQLMKIKEQWDPNSPKCGLKTHFYNKFNDQEINNLLNQPRPQNESPEDWDNAMSNRPSSQYYPVKVTSFTEVAQRIEVQLDHVAKSRILLNAINDKQTALSSKHDLDNTTRISKAKAMHTKLSRRLLRLATVLAILKLKGYPLLPEEEEISKQFNLLNHKLNDPNGSLGKLNDVFARLAILKERSEELANQFDSSLSSMNGINPTGSKEIDGSNDAASDKNNDELITKLSKVLLKQQMGLNHLNEILEKDLEVVKKAAPKS